MRLKGTLLHYSGYLRRVPPYPRTAPPITLIIVLLLEYLLLVCVSERKGEREERVRVYMIHTGIHIYIYICIYTYMQICMYMYM